MGILQSLFGKISSDENRLRPRDVRGQVEVLEPRQLLSGDGLAPEVLLGGVYFEEATGDDSQADVIQIGFVGGAQGTTLDRLVIDGDKRLDGLTDGDIFFDVEAGGAGAFEAVGLTVLSQDGFNITSVAVVDGGTDIVFTFSGFDAGEILEFSVDVDELQFADPAGDSVNSLVEGAEFERSHLVGDFSAVGYVDLTLTTQFWDAFDGRRATAESATGLELDLPDDAYTSARDFTDRTAGAVAHEPQVELASLSGYVYHDQSNDGTFDRPGEEGIGGVTLELLDASGNPTGVTTTTSTEPGKVGFYEFRNLVAGTYGVREVQPEGWLDGKDTPGNFGGTAADESAGPVDRITGATLDFGDHAVEYNFGELLVGSIAGRIHASTGPDCDFENPEIILAGVQVDLLDANGQFLQTTTTDDQGRYKFSDLAPGEYQIREHQPDGYYDGDEHIGTAGGTASDPSDEFSFISEIQLGSGVDATGYHFCEHVGPSLSGWVYHDRSNEGIFDRGTEEGIGGVVMELLDATGTPTGITTTTSADAGNVGYYEFTNLAPGNYGVREFQPTGWIDGIDTPGTHGGTAADESAGRVDRITGAMLNFGDVAREYNFGELLAASIAGRVSAHNGPDCDFDNPQILLSGVQIDLLDEAGNFVATTFTNGLGEYSFAGLAPGVYQVFEHQPEDYFDGEERVGTAGGMRTGTDTIGGIELVSAQEAVNYDFCEHTPGSIAGIVVASTGPDCNFDNPEIRLAGVRVDLLDAAGNLITSTTTNDQGEYRFDGLAAGEYRIHEHQPDGYFDGDEQVGSAGGRLIAPDDIAGIQLEFGEDAVNYNFCEHQGVNLSGYVYHDRSNDGVFDRPTETGIAEVALKLLDGDGNDTGMRAVTDSRGFYQFSNLQAGKYAVMEIQPEGWLDGIDTPGNLGGVADPSPPGDMLSEIMLTFGQSGEEYNFGELLPGSIRGRVHLTTDPDCEPNEDDPPIAGVVMELLDEQGNLLTSTTTNDRGEYEFTDLRPGEYTVRQQQPIEYFNGGYHIGTGGGAILGENLIGQITVGSGEDLAEYDFCELPPAELSGYVFIDGAPILSLNPLPPDISALRDGQRTPDDTPIAGVTLELRHGFSGEPILAEEALTGHYADGPIRTVTDANGFYEFTGLPGGSYGVVEVQPEGLIDGIDTQGTLGGLAVNPVGAANDPTLNQNGGITDPEAQAISQMRQRFGNDVIFRVALPAGAESLENNFSEVDRTTIFIPPETDPPVKPPVFTPPTFRPPVNIFPLVAEKDSEVPFYGGGSKVIGYTWHLSLVNAGFPRSTPLIDGQVMQFTSQQMAIAWQEANIDQAEWQLERDSNQSEDDSMSGVIAFGNAQAIPVVGDWDGDGKDEVGVFVNGRWYIDLNGNGHWDAGDLLAHLGTGQDLPTTGDWDGDGKTDIAIFGPVWAGDPWAIENEPGLPDAENFPGPIAGKEKNVPPKFEEATHGVRELKLTRTGEPRVDLIDHVFHYGVPGDKPITGDWNGDGIATIGVFRDGVWYLDTDGDGRFTTADIAAEFDSEFGAVLGENATPVIGDWNGDGIDDLGLFVDGHWKIDSNGDRQFDARDRAFELGGPNDKPVAGDWNGDGIDQPGIYSPTGSEAPEPELRISKRAG